eukprot:TRINITY_DN30747_c0_g1_i1.p1 TRINITY_DN30747_c0_g1~~TRINITY_DN30747_c0_g1_i1.p1  ORF type:complete len:325 (-),score=63.66 TRINITY_DN30747_c0_g1_i1:29-976(-)
MAKEDSQKQMSYATVSFLGVLLLIAFIFGVFVLNGTNSLSTQINNIALLLNATQMQSSMMVSSFVSSSQFAINGYDQSMQDVQTFDVQVNSTFQAITAQLQTGNNEFVQTAIALGTNLSNTSVANGCSGMTCPVLPNLTPITLSKTQTAILVVDLIPSICYKAFANTNCNDTIIPVQTLLSVARSSQVPIIFTTVKHDVIISDVANQTNETVLNTFGSNKFFKTNLQELLVTMNISTLVVAGTHANGAILQMGQQVPARGLTYIVPADTISADSDYIKNYVLYQLLNHPVYQNPQNQPTITTASVLTAVPLITLQ